MPRGARSQAAGPALQSGCERPSQSRRFGAEKTRSIARVLRSAPEHVLHRRQHLMRVELSSSAGSRRVPPTAGNSSGPSTSRGITVTRSDCAATTTSLKSTENGWPTNFGERGALWMRPTREILATASLKSWRRVRWRAIRLVPTREVLEHEGALGPDTTEETCEDHGDHAGHHRSGRPKVNIDKVDGVSTRHRDPALQHDQLLTQAQIHGDLSPLWGLRRDRSSRPPDHAEPPSLHPRPAGSLSQGRPEGKDGGSTVDRVLAPYRVT